MLLLFFGAVVVATILRSLAGLIEAYAPVRSPWSLVLSGLAIAALNAAFVFLLGAQIAAEEAPPDGNRTGLAALVGGAQPGRLISVVTCPALTHGTVAFGRAAPLQLLPGAHGC